MDICKQLEEATCTYAPYHAWSLCTVLYAQSLRQKAIFTFDGQLKERLAPKGRPPPLAVVKSYLKAWRSCMCAPLMKEGINMLLLLLSVGN